MVHWSVYLLIPVALAVVAGVLIMGLINFAANGSPQRSQKLMQMPGPARRLPTRGACADPCGPRDDRTCGKRAMVKLNKIYTRTGDDGTTGLGTGERVPKHDLRVEAYGTVDEANATLGLVRLHLASEPELDAILVRIQNDLFDLGADLCTPDRPGAPPLGYEPL
eukprot:gene19104-23402_t